MLRDKRVLAIVSLLIAIALWMYVMGSVDPKTTDLVTGVKVEMQNQDYLDKQGLTATLNSPNKISFTIEGKRSDVNFAKKKGFSAYVDVSTCDYGENEADIHVVTPDGVSIVVEDLSEETAKFTVK